MAGSRMNLGNDVFDKYFKREIDRAELSAQLGTRENFFVDSLIDEMRMCAEVRDALRFEYLVYALFVWDEDCNSISELDYYIDDINSMLLMDWHTQHENLVAIIQKVADASSMEYLEKAIDLDLKYLEWDDNHSFEIKCVRAIYQIGKSDAKPFLERISASEVECIREMAVRQMGKIE